MTTHMTMLDDIKHTAHMNRIKARAAELALEDQRRKTCNAAARILRKLGFANAYAEQSDTGRRDAFATFIGPRCVRTIVVGIFSDGRPALLDLNGYLDKKEWLPIRKDLADLPTTLRQNLTELFAQR